VVLPETGTAAAALVARRILELLEAEAEQPPLAVSVGIASYPADADGLGTLLYAADKALYAMKSKNSRRPFSPHVIVADHARSPRR
jgi:GGDEF domain-containing protein